MTQLLRPSGHHRWSKCTASAKLEQSFPSTTNPAAELGTKLHADCAFVLTELLASRAVDLEQYDPIVIKYVNSLFEQYRIHTADQTWIEQPVDLDAWLGAEAKGTPDFAALFGTTLQVHDFKSGRKTEHFSETSGQIRIYALGLVQVVEAYGLEVDKIVLVIHQPTMKSEPDEFTISAKSLKAFGEKLLDDAAKAREGGTFSPGEHCEYCKYAHKCEALHEYVQAQITGDAALGDKYAAISTIEAYVQSITDAVNQSWDQGIPVPGTRRVAGREGHRQWTLDDYEIIELASDVLPKDAVYVAKVVTPTVMEQVAKKAKQLPWFKESLEPYITRNPAKPKIVLDTPANAKYADYTGDTTGFNPIE